MALLNISLVTESLTKLVQEYFKASPAWRPAAPPTISPQPPDKLSGDAVGIYLYHITEDPQYKNLSPPGKGLPPVSYVPMGLSLYYQLTAHSASDDTHLEQKMMGIAIKALHDYPIIDDTTKLDGVKIFPTPLQGKNNRLRIVLQPVIHNEAISYWTAGTSPLRLATYYQVSVVLLEPEETKSRAGRVLLYDIQTFTGGAPRLESSENTISFKIPRKPDTHEIELRPAQVPPAKAGISPAPEDSKVTLKGTGLRGDKTSLLLKSPRWKEPVEADQSWEVTVKADEVSAIVQEKASGKDVIPGIYSAVIKVITRRTMSDGSPRDFEHISNETPFVITPRIDKPESDAVGTPDGSGVVTIGGYAFKHADIPPESVQVFLGSKRLIRQTATTIEAGKFRVVSAKTIKFKKPAEVSPGTFPLRVFVNGAESPPRWVQV